MFHQSKGIVFSQTRFSDSSVIARIYTEEFGLLSFMLRGVHKKNSKIPPSILQHLYPVEICFQLSQKRSIQQVRSVSAAFHFHSIPYDMAKTAVILFLNEMLVKSIREEEANKELFNFIIDSLLELDNLKENISGFHILFLLKLSRYLGFYPSSNFSEKTSYFNLEEGRFMDRRAGVFCLDIELSAMLSALICCSKFEGGKVPSKIRRNELLQAMVNYYSLHLPDFGKVKSLDILSEIMR